MVRKLFSIRRVEDVRRVPLQAKVSLLCLPCCAASDAGTVESQDEDFFMVDHGAEKFDSFGVLVSFFDLKDTILAVLA